MASPPDRGRVAALRQRATTGASVLLGKQPTLARLVRRRGHAERVAFYGGFVSAGDLVFDVGAHIGNRTDVFREIGARVIAVEPQPRCVRELHKRYRADPAVTVIPKGLAAEPGSAVMQTANASTLSTFSDEFREATASSGRFTGIRWERSDPIELTTLDALVAEFGVPVFCKIDVEGYESEVLAGLTRPLELVSIEWAPEGPDWERALARLVELGARRFNLSLGESYTFEFPEFVSITELRETLEPHRESLQFGDIYADFR